jgi:hypothetical protein
MMVRLILRDRVKGHDKREGTHALGCGIAREQAAYARVIAMENFMMPALRVVIDRRTMGRIICP